VQELPCSLAVVPFWLCGVACVAAVDCRWRAVRCSCAPVQQAVLVTHRAVPQGSLVGAALEGQWSAEQLGSATADNGLITVSWQQPQRQADPDWPGLAAMLSGIPL